MKNNLKLLAVMLVLFFAGCSSNNLKQSGMTFFNDFESIKGWGGDMSRLTDAQAHSGKYSTFIDSTYEYSFTFKISFKDISKERVKGLNYSIWCYAGALPVSGTIVASAKSSTVDPVSWNGNNLENYITEPRKWIKIKSHIDFDPKAVNSENEFGFYLTGKTVIYADDFTLEFTK